MNRIMGKKELISKIISENRFKTRKEKDPNSCPCYNGNKCHDMNDYELICLLCVCPEYKRNPNNLEGGCKINSSFGKWFYHEDLPTGRIWDCSDCKLPHAEGFVKNYLEKLSVEKLEEIRKCKTIDSLWEFFEKV